MVPAQADAEGWFTARFQLVWQFFETSPFIQLASYEKAVFKGDLVTQSGRRRDTT